MRILFMGTPEFAVPSLEALLTAGHQVCGVFTQPDKPKNRGMKLQTSPVKECALSLKLHAKCHSIISLKIFCLFLIFSPNIRYARETQIYRTGSYVY